MIDIDWGDDTYKTRARHYQTKTDGATEADTQFDVDDASGFFVGDYIFLTSKSNGFFDEDIVKITQISGNTITVDTALDHNHPNDTPVTLFHTHVYAEAATYKPGARVYNDAGFRSDYEAAGIFVIATTAPVAVPLVSPSEAKTGDSVMFAGTDSYPTDDSKSITNFDVDADYNAGDAGSPISLTSAAITVFKWDRVLTHITNQPLQARDLTIESSESADTSLQVQIVGENGGSRVRVRKATDGSDGTTPVLCGTTVDQVDHIIIESDSADPENNPFTGNLIVKANIDGTIIATITPTQHEAIRNGYTYVFGMKTNDGTTDSAQATYNQKFTRKQTLVLENILTDFYQDLNIPEMIRVHSQEGEQRNEVDESNAKIIPIKINASAWTSGGYTSVTINADGSTTFAGSGSVIPDDILVLLEIKRTGGYLVSITPASIGTTYTGVLRIDKIGKMAGDMTIPWSATLFIEEV
jgi:hypothetical protein